MNWTWSNAVNFLRSILIDWVRDKVYENKNIYNILYILYTFKVLKARL